MRPEDMIQASKGETKIQASRDIWRAVVYPLPSDEFDAVHAGIAPIDGKPKDAPATEVANVRTYGTVTLANGYKRRAFTHIGQFSGRRFWNYLTPAGHQKHCTPAVAATFVADHVTSPSL